MYDEANRRTEEIEPDPGGPGFQTSPISLYQYDNDGNVLSVTNTYALNVVCNGGSSPAQDIPVAVAGDPSYTTAYQYDSLGRKTEEICLLPTARTRLFVPSHCTPMITTATFRRSKIHSEMLPNTLMTSWGESQR